jgi:hypothetical protein
MEGLTAASADDLPPLGELLVDDPFWQYPARGLAREGAGHLGVWAIAGGIRMHQFWPNHFLCPLEQAA